MNRENRYIVIKRKDAEKHLSQGELDTLHILADQVADGREYDQKPPLNCVVVESDWPEYEPTWAAIAARVDGAPQPVPADEADGEESREDKP